METYVIGKISEERARSGSLDGVVERLSPVGYNFSAEPGYFTFKKPGRVESVITEMVPVCEDHGLDVEDFLMIEYRTNDGTQRSRYEDGKIVRYH